MLPRVLSRWMSVVLIGLIGVGCLSPAPPAPVAVAPAPVFSPPPPEDDDASQDQPAVPTPAPVLRDAPKQAERETPVFDQLIAPFANEAANRRNDRAASDPTFLGRIDGALNDGRINFLLYGYGETHEPPRTERAFIGSYTIVSYNWRQRTVDLVSLTHDIRAPEIERAKRAKGEPQRAAMKIDQAYAVGGFDLTRLVIESATGLAIDFQIAFQDAAIAEAVDSIFGGIPVDVPAEFRVNAFYLDGHKYPAGVFKKGPQTLDGKQVIQFIKTVPIEAPGTYNKNLEHNARKHLVVRGVLEALQANAVNPITWFKTAAFLKGTLDKGGVAFDFDPTPLILNNIAIVAANSGRFLFGDALAKEYIPVIRRTVYIHDPKSGDGGVQWVPGNALINRTTKRDIDLGIYPDQSMAIPTNANPYADNLVTGYWPSLRQRIRQLIR